MKIAKISMNYLSFNVKKYKSQILFRIKIIKESSI